MLFILANPISGDQSALKKINIIQESYPQVETSVFLTSKKDQEKEIVEKILVDFDSEKDQLMIIGGDGTLSKVLVHWPEDYPFAFLQSGSGNDFGKGYPLPDIPILMEALEQKRVAKMKVLRSKDYVVINSLGAGFDARVIERSERTIMKKWFNRLRLGRFLYPFIGFLAMFSRKTVSVQLTDEKGQVTEMKRLFLFIVANNRYFGGGVMIWPDTSVEHSHFDLVTAPYRSIVGNVICLLELLFKRHKTSKHLQRREVKRLSIQFAQEQGVQIDGEFVTMKEIELEGQTRFIYR